MTITASNTIDVRDMLCAQAIAQADRAMQCLSAGGILELVCNAADVKQDILSWAKELGHVLVGTEDRSNESWLWIRKRE